MKWTDRWLVKSHSCDKEYTVSRSDDDSARINFPEQYGNNIWGCSCPAWKFQRKRIRDGICKHIREVQNSILGLTEEEVINSQNFYPDHIKRDAFFTEEDFAL